MSKNSRYTDEQLLKKLQNIEEGHSKSEPDSSLGDSSELSTKEDDGKSGEIKIPTLGLQEESDLEES